MKPRVSRCSTTPVLRCLEGRTAPSGIFWNPALTPVEYGGAGEIGTWKSPQQQTDPMAVPPPSSVAG
jgi:hypothetical protein